MINFIFETKYKILFLISLDRNLTQKKKKSRNVENRLILIVSFFDQYFINLLKKMLN